MLPAPARPAPEAPRRPYAHREHDVTRDDPWAWLRDKNSPESLTYLAQERSYYDEATRGLAQVRARLEAEMDARVAPSEESVRWREGDFWYFTAAVPGREYRQLRRVRVDAPAQEEPELLLDENHLAQGHDFVELGVRLVSPGGHVLAYSVDHAGDEVYQLRFRDLDSGQDLPDVVRHTYYTGAWSADGSCFFYTVNDDLYRPFQVWRHALGTSSSDDALVFEDLDDQFDVTVEASRTDEWIVIESHSRNTSEVWLVPSADPTRAPRVVEPRRRGVEYSVEHAPGADGGDLLITTNDGAVEFRLVRAPAVDPRRANWREVVAENPDERLHGVDVFARHAVLNLVRDAQQVLRIVELELLREPLEPGSGIDLTPRVPAGLLTLGPNEEPDVDSILVDVESVVEPRTWYSVSLETGEWTLVKQIEVPTYDAGRYVVDQIEVVARDGESIPVTVVRRDDVQLDGSAPALLYGYGAYESSWWPGFEPALASLLDAGMVYVHAHVRGGGERGRRWWLDGCLGSKVHT
ncbi:MAG: oligopeptidase B, partial [Actinomycetes bacterium]